MLLHTVSCHYLRRKLRLVYSYGACVLTAGSLQHLLRVSSSICHLNADLKGDLGDFKFLLKINYIHSHSVLVPLLMFLTLFCVVLSIVFSNHVR